MAAIEIRLRMAMEVRDSLEVTHTGEYFNFLKFYTRAFSVILYHITKPQFSQNPENKLRNMIVEILSRLPHSEVLRPFAQEILRVALHVLTADNEDNGVLCMRIIVDLVRHFKLALENEVQPFLDFVYEVYRNLSLNATHFFEGGAVPSAAESVSGPETSTTSFTGLENISPTGMEISGRAGVSDGFLQLNPCTRSFKVVAECPVVVMFMFHLYGRLVETTIPHLVPLMIGAISIQGPERVPNHLTAHLADLKAAQAKVSAHQWQPYQF